MKLDFFHDQTLDAMGAYMTRLSNRQQVVFSNLANRETPDFKTKDISFHATMEELLSETIDSRTERAKHSDGWIPFSPQAQEVQGLPSGSNNNNVDLDQELMKISETAFGYSLISQLLRAKFRTIGLSINEGKA
jgi:flagellar basal-body rod protein FlgB